MKLKIILLLIVGSLITGCSENSENSTPTLAGEWKLINVSGGLLGVNDNFSPGLIKWQVDTVAQTVTVVNNNTNTAAQDILESGVYPYTLQADTNGICTETFNVNNMDMGCFSVSPNNLVITYNYADGFTLNFVR